MNITILKKIGLNDKEIKVYLSLLEYGAVSIRGLADITGLNRGTVYDILKKLQNQGLASYYHKEKKQQFVAEEPEKLLKIINDKTEKLQKAKNSLKELIPELSSLKDKGPDKPVTKFYEGKPGIKFILEDLLSTVLKDNEYYIYSATNASDDLNNAYPNFTRDRIKKKIHVKAISLAKGGTLSGLDERRWLGTEDESATFIIIYSNKCAFISRDARNQPVGVIIENKMIYETQKKIFLQLWKLLK